MSYLLLTIISLAIVFNMVSGASDATNSCNSIKLDYPYYSSSKGAGYYITQGTGNGGGITLELAQLECITQCTMNFHNHGEQCIWARTNLISDYEYECYLFDESTNNNDISFRSCSEITKEPYSTFDGSMYCENELTFLNKMAETDYERMWATLQYANGDYSGINTDSCYRKCINDEKCKSFRSDYVGPQIGCNNAFRCMFFDDLQGETMEKSSLCKQTQIPYPYMRKVEGLTLELAEQWYPNNAGRNGCKAQCDYDNECYFHLSSFPSTYQFECNYFGKEAWQNNYNVDYKGNVCHEMTVAPYATFDGLLYCENTYFMSNSMVTEFDFFWQTLQYANFDVNTEHGLDQTDSCYIKCMNDEQCKSFRSEYKGKVDGCYFGFKCLFFVE